MRYAWMEGKYHLKREENTFHVFQTPLEVWLNAGRTLLLPSKQVLCGTGLGKRDDFKLLQFTFILLQKGSLFHLHFLHLQLKHLVMYCCPHLHSNQTARTLDEIKLSFDRDQWENPGNDLLQNLENTEAKPEAQSTSHLEACCCVSFPSLPLTWSSQGLVSSSQSQSPSQTKSFVIRHAHIGQ